MKTAVLIDGSNTYMAMRNLYDIDWNAFRRYYNKHYPMVQLLYYTAVHTIDGHADIRPLVDWLDFNGYRVIQKPTKTFNNELNGLTKVKGDMDVEIAVDMVKLSRRVDHIILYSGDGDFVPAIHAVQSEGCYVTVVSAMNVVADELRRACNIFIDIAELQGVLCRGKTSASER